MQVLNTAPDPLSPQVRHGLEPEFIGRIPVRVACQRLREADLFRVRACMQVLTTARRVPTAARGRSVSGAHRRARECQHASAHYGAPLSHRCSPTRTTRWRRRSCEISKGARQISSAPDRMASDRAIGWRLITIVIAYYGRYEIELVLRPCALREVARRAAAEQASATDCH